MRREIFSGVCARLGTHPIDPARSAEDLGAIAAMSRPTSGARSGIFASKLRVAAAFFAGLLVGSTGLAAADALPDPAQHVAHQVLSQVGVDVPNPDRYHGPECGPEQRRNHGAYVRDDHSLAQSDCGKKLGAGGAGDDDEADEGDERGKADGQGNGNGQGNGKPASGDPCRGKPPWAGNKTMTPEEVTAAKAVREACPDDEDAPELEDDDDAADERQADVTTTTTESEATTTTTEAPTTTTTA